MEEAHEYIIKRKEILENLLSFIDGDDDINFQDLMKQIQKEYEANSDILIFLLIFLNNISHNHHRSSDFYPKIEQIIIYFNDLIKSKLSDLNIYEIFEESNRILYFLFRHKIIEMNNDILKKLFVHNQSKYKLVYLIPVIKDLIDEEKRELLGKTVSNYIDKEESIEDMEKKCQIGENELTICTLIRNDSIDEFIIYVNERNISLSSKIKGSIFETNSLLNIKHTTFIEYAAFFGSLKIFQFLKLNNVELAPSLWIYAIHGRNPEIIHILEELNIKPNDDTFEHCLKEAVKCYHNEIAIYIYDNLLIDNKYQQFNKDHIDIIFYKQTFFSYVYKYYNFPLIEQIFDDNKYTLLYLCQYNYIDLVKLLLKTGNFDINVKLILICFFYDVSNHF